LLFFGASLAACAATQPRRVSLSEPLVGLIMGSRSDWETLSHAAAVLESLGIPFEKKVVSAHRTPDLLFDYAGSAASRGLAVVIAGAGGAAHLPGMAAAKTHLPVIGVPIESRSLKGIDSLLSIVQMPAGVPVATMSIGRSGATNAALLAASILALQYPRIKDALLRYRSEQTRGVLEHPDPAEDA
jgi:5-(carboxyamino)imidazole ribonucleotide mutase